MNSPGRSRQSIITKQQSVLSFKSTLDLFGVKSKSSLLDYDERKKRFNRQSSLDENVLGLKIEEPLAENPIESDETPKSNTNLNPNPKEKEHEGYQDPEVMKMEEELEYHRISKTQYM